MHPTIHLSSIHHSIHTHSIPVSVTIKVKVTVMETETVTLAVTITVIATVTVKGVPLLQQFCNGYAMVMQRCCNETVTVRLRNENGKVVFYVMLYLAFCFYKINKKQIEGTFIAFVSLRKKFPLLLLRILIINF